MILLLFSLDFCLVFYHIYLKNIWINFLYPTVFTIARVFLCTIDTEGGDGTANFIELDPDYSEPGKHVWILDMMSVLACLHWIVSCHVHKHPDKFCFMKSWEKWVTEIHDFMEMRLHGHVMAWKWVRWQCCSMPVLCQTIWLQCHRESSHVSIRFPFLYYHMFSARDMS